MSIRAAEATDPGDASPPSAEPEGGLDRLLGTAMFETIEALVVVLDRSGRIVRFNPACERLTGYSAGEAIGRSVAELVVPPEEASEVLAIIRGLTAGETPVSHENHWVTRSGEWHRIAWTASVLTDPGGGVDFVIGTGLDVTERRRAKDALAGIDAVRSLLEAEGLTPGTLQEIVAVLAGRFGYAHVSIYLADESRLRLGASVGYEDPIAVFDAGHGVIGRSVRARHAVVVEDVSADPDYIAVDPAVRSEIAVPLIAQGELLGVLNVESSREDRPLDEQDRVLLEAIADRLATATALGQERRALFARAELLSGLLAFTQSVTSTLQAEHLWDLLLGGVAKALPADVVVLTILDRPSGRYLMRAGLGLDASALGLEIRPGEGVTGRAIRDRVIVVEDDLPRTAYPSATRGLVEFDRLAAVGVPLVREESVVGALMVGRADRSRRFSSLELDALGIIGNQAALTVANTFLYADVAELAIRDALTGLHNRRYLDTSLERIVAAWLRAPEPERRPLSAVMFDLDNFGRFNMEHGHLVGDALLRAFAELLQRRFRASDLVARFGGEEFVAILEGTTLDEAAKVAEEVRLAFHAITVPGAHGEALSCTVSAGCATLVPDEATPRALLRAADLGLFAAKRAGRDRVVTVGSPE